MPLSFPLVGRLHKEHPAGPVEWLIVGLGNPGKKYEQTRHNAGWHVLDRVVRDYPQFCFNEKRSKGLIARGELAGSQVALVKPQTYMNLSGQAVAPIARFYKVPPAHILVIYDDLDLPRAVLKIRKKGGAGGHKGMKSIIQHLGTQDYPRLRLGVGRPPSHMLAETYLLQKFKPAEWADMVITYDRSVEAIEAILRNGLDNAMNKYNVLSS